MTLNALLEGSAGVWMPAGFAVGTMTVRRLPANFVGAPEARPLSTSFWGFDVSAERNTSTGAPCSIFVSSADDESVDTVNDVPGWAAVYASVALARAALSEAAA